MIYFWNRKEQKKQKEEVYGEAWLNTLYGTGAGQALADRVLSRAFLSKAYGLYQASSLSRHKIQPFISDFHIPMEEYEEGPFQSFNDFFIRKFKDGKRPFVQDEKRMPAFAEARYFAYERVTNELKIPVKGQFLSAEALLGSAELAKPFMGGPLLLARLCPTDYHRFHFPDSGKIEKAFTIPGKLHSVNPLALQYRPQIFVTNERQVSLLETDHFGKLAYIEVGALCVGKIVQTHDPKVPFKRGQEKGYFLFGASTVIVLGEPGGWIPDSDLLEQTSQNVETFVLLGESVAKKV